MTQTELIHRHLEKKPINPYMALNHYGCFRLAARIWELKKQGLKIKTTLRTTRDGKKTFAEYSLE